MKSQQELKYIEVNIANSLANKLNMVDCCSCQIHDNVVVILGLGAFIDKGFKILAKQDKEPHLVIQCGGKEPLNVKKTDFFSVKV